MDFSKRQRLNVTKKTVAVSTSSSIISTKPTQPPASLSSRSSNPTLRTFRSALSTRPASTTSNRFSTAKSRTNATGGSSIGRAASNNKSVNGRRPAQSGTPQFSDSDSNTEDDSHHSRDDSSNGTAASKKRLHSESREGSRSRRKLDVPRSWDLDRRIRAEPNEVLDRQAEKDLIHGIELVELENNKPGKGPKYAPFFADDEVEGGTVVELCYPGSLAPERIRLVRPLQNDLYAPIESIKATVKTICTHFLPAELGEVDPEFPDWDKGFPYRLRRAENRGSLSEFVKELNDFNDLIKRSLQDGTIAKHLEGKHAVDPTLMKFVIDQVFERTVSPQVEIVRKYTSGTDNIYGELMPTFSTLIFNETQLRSDQVFVDLGSGVGNVVLQAALEAGCESWGCEMMDNPCNLADAQGKEFIARCRLYGISVGSIHLERGDFLISDKIHEKLKQADVVLINNEKFSPETNEKLKLKFLEFKEGCRIVSLQSFVPYGHKLEERNIENPINILKNRPMEYFSGCVSWAGTAGKFYIATVDRSAVRRFRKEHGL